MKNVVIAVVVVVVLAGLGAGGYVLTRHKSNTTTTDNMNMNSSQNSSTAPVATNQVTIKNLSFSPMSITVKKGTTVTWTNQDSPTHTVTSDNGSATVFDSKSLDSGKTFSFTFNNTGTFNYHCNIHSSMMGTVTVTE